MKKLINAALGLLCSAAAFAQPANRTYTLDPGYKMAGFYNSAAWIDPAVGGGDYFTTNVYTAGSSSYDSLMVVKVDGAFNYATHVMYHVPYGYRQRLISTSDTSLVLAFTNFINGNQYGVTLIKYDVNLNQIWNVTLDGVSGVFYLSGLDIEAVTDPATGLQDYYVLYSANINGTDFSVARVASNGTVLWQNQYTDNSGSSDAPSALTSYNDSATGDPRIVIAGSRGVELFGMTIDDAGSIVTPYTAIATFGVDLEWPDIVYDGEHLVITYVQENNGSSVPGATTNASFIGIVKTDLSFNPIYATVHWITCENYGLGISVAPSAAGATKPEYIVSGWTRYCTSVTGDEPTPVLMKIDGSTGNPVWTRRYNILRPAEVTNGRHVQDAGNNIHMAYSVDVSPDAGTRLLVTTPSGSACGELTPDVQSYEISATTTTYSYMALTAPPPIGAPLNVLNMPVVHQSACDPNNGSAPNYRLAQAGPAVSIAPTLLYSAAETVTCNIASDVPATASVRITNLLGQRIYTAAQQLHRGSNSFSIPAVFAHGINMVQVSIDGKPVFTTRVSLVE